MYTVSQLLQNKGAQVWSTRPDATVYSALELMSEKDIGALPVMEGDRLVGIFSERDYARKVILFGKSSRETQVQEVMTPRVVCVRLDDTIEACMALMTQQHIRHLPVKDADRVVGLISIGDVVKAVISHQEFVIEQLEHYITGKR
jgi:CBS domain-containing protein